MPIKKENFALYPHNWRKISWWIINIRAQNHCEGILENGERCMAENHKPHPVTGKKVVLSVAHLDHNPENSDQNLSEEDQGNLSKSNMRAFCQRCHNRWDREHRNESIRETYKEKHGEIIITGTPYLAPNDEYIEAEITEYMKAHEEQTIDKLMHTLLQLIIELGPQESAEAQILLKSLELKEEYGKLLAMGTAEFNSLGVQVRLTVCKQKMQVIGQLIELQKITSKSMDRVREGRTTPAIVQGEVIAPEDDRLRGMGIRKFIADKKNNFEQPT